MELYLLHTQPDLKALTAWATRKRWLSPDGDLGYALHALLAAAFDGAPPVPYRYSGDQGLLAYTKQPPDQLQAKLAGAPVEARRILCAQHLRTRRFPTDWSEGKRLGFEVRLRPVLRTKAKAERDLYQYRMEQRPVDAADPKPTREAVYLQWLEQRLQANQAARMVAGRMIGFSLRQVVRRPQQTGETGRQPRTVTGPDVLFSGELEVNGPGAFANLLAQGLGRHRAFGYGMLLLRPASRG